MAAPPLSAVSPVAKDAAALAAKLHLDPAVGFADGAPAAMAVRPLAGGVDGFVATAVLTHEECASLVAQTEGAGYTFWHPEDTPAKRAFRSADTVEVHAPDLAEVVWRRVRAHVTQEVRLRDADDDRGRGGGDDDDGREPADDRGAEGTWQAYGVNPDMLFARYEPGGHFAPHTDGSAVVDFNDRSLFSLLVYLTTAQGGGTRIVRPGCDATIGDALTTDANGRFRHSLGDEACVAARARLHPPRPTRPPTPVLTRCRAPSAHTNTNAATSTTVPARWGMSSCSGKRHITRASRSLMVRAST